MSAKSFMGGRLDDDSSRKRKKSTTRGRPGTIESIEPNDAIFSEWSLNHDLNQPFQYTPQKPEDDAWSLLLEPLLKKDREQCQVWKDEVENLLIFAGLFSAVVTTFVVESWKDLRPEPEDTLVVLLTHLVTRLDNDTNAPLNPRDIAFTPDRASVRLNSFWLVSLVLSLTTVLVGIIGLQWLREHQSYPDLKARESFAIYHMRAESLEKWYVPKIFTALPILLLAALILFLAGLVDFCLPLGNAVSIPSIVVITLTLLFLSVTTILPTLQGLALYFPYFRSRAHLSAPAQCPYKSPQSRAFRVLSHGAFQLADYLYQSFGYHLRVSYNHILRIFGKNNEVQRAHVPYIIPFLAETWGYRTWANFDISWIFLRDAWAMGTIDHDEGIGEHLKAWHRQLHPLYDLVLGLREAIDTNTVEEEDEYLAAGYHCYLELSQTSVTRVSGLRASGHDFDDAGRHLRYFQELLRSEIQDDGVSPLLSEYLDFKLDRPINMGSIQARSALLHHENIVLFLSAILRDTSHTSFVGLQMLKEEVKIKTLRWVLQEYEVVKPLAMSLDKPPPCLDIRLFDLSRFVNLQQDDYVEKGHELYWQYMNILLDFFKYTTVDSPRDWTENIHSTKHISTLMTEAAAITKFFVVWYSDRQPFQSTDVIFSSLCTLIDDTLSTFMDFDNKDDGHTNLNLLFYSASLFLRPLSLPQSDPSQRMQYVYKELNKVLPTLMRYKQDFLDSDVFFEERFSGVDDGIPRFSKEWWSFLETMLYFDQASPRSQYYYYAAGGEIEISEYNDTVPSHLLNAIFPRREDGDGFLFGLKTKATAHTDNEIHNHQFASMMDLGHIEKNEEESYVTFGNPDADKLV